MSDRRSFIHFGPGFERETLSWPRALPRACAPARWRLRLPVYAIFGNPLQCGYIPDILVSTAHEASITTEGEKRMERIMEHLAKARTEFNEAVAMQETAVASECEILGGLDILISTAIAYQMRLRDAIRETLSPTTTRA